MGYEPFEMGEIARHGHDVILDVSQVQADLRARCNLPVLVATLCKTFDDVGLVAQ